mmetsp:Transcript_48870/g.139942  ORF Transcript_48870/g.139942 Transcript_48870/m.139942 type:complete len:208 (-) Transcript_48870:197-820(-)
MTKPELGLRAPGSLRRSLGLGPLVPLLLGPLLVAVAATVELLPFAGGVELGRLAQLRVCLVGLGVDGALLHLLLLHQLGDGLVKFAELLRVQAALQLLEGVHQELDGDPLRLAFVHLGEARVAEPLHVGLNLQLHPVEGVDHDNLRLGRLAPLLLLPLGPLALGLCRILGGGGGAAAREEVLREPRVGLLHELLLPELLGHGVEQNL